MSVEELVVIKRGDENKLKARWKQEEARGQIRLANLPLQAPKTALGNAENA